MTDERIKELEKAIGAKPVIVNVIEENGEISENFNINNCIAFALWWRKAAEHESARAERLQKQVDELIAAKNLHGAYDFLNKLQ